MGRNIRVKGVKRKEVDEDKLALAFLMLAKALREPAADESAGERKRSNEATS